MCRCYVLDYENLNSVSYSPGLCSSVPILHPSQILTITNLKEHKCAMRVVDEIRNPAKHDALRNAKERRGGHVHVTAFKRTDACLPIAGAGYEAEHEDENGGLHLKHHKIRGSKCSRARVGTKTTCAYLFFLVGKCAIILTHTDRTGNQVGAPPQ